MTLYEMTAAEQALYDLLCSEEIDEQTFTDTVNGIGIGDKIDSYCCIIQQLKADYNSCKAEKQRFDSRMKMFENAQNRMKQAIDDYLSATGKEKTKTAKFTVYHTNTKSVNITDLSQIPDEFIKPRAEENVKKSEILKILKSGKSVNGAEMIEKKSLVIR